MYISYCKKINIWTTGYIPIQINPDPFSYITHRSRQSDHDKAINLAQGLRGEVPYMVADRLISPISTEKSCNVHPICATAPTTH